MKSKVLMVIAILLLLGVYFVPIWMISLEAPQFPEGLGLWIKINTIEGFKETDLNSINILNHYIGMKKIEPEKIPEFKVMPWILGFLIAFGFATLFIDKNWLKYLLIFLILVACALGIYDFYLWGYEYGHSLDPKAVIKIEGMSYQPPLIGSKKLLNITAHSYPYIGSILLLLSTVLIFLSIVFKKK